MPPHVVPERASGSAHRFSESTVERSREVTNVSERISTIERSMRELENKNERNTRQYENLERQLRETRELQTKVIDAATISTVSDIVGKRVETAPLLIDNIVKNNGEPQTPQEKLVKESIDKNIQDNLAKIDEVKDKPGFMQSLEKYTLTIGLLTMVGSGLFSLWDSKHSTETAACYQMTTCQTPPVIKKVSCSKEGCDCKHIAKCNLPECYLKTYGCLTYIYTNFDPKEIISSLPEIEVALDNNPVIKRYNFMKNLQKFLIVFAVVVLVGYFLLKLALKNKSLL